MPIHTSVPIQVFDQEQFHQIDRQVTGIAFDIQNEFGRYMHEKLYQRELTRRCRNAGLAVEPEMKITVSLDDFSKDYYSDHLINRGVIVESKATSSLSSAHKGQTLNYLLLCGLHHATLLNFRPERVQHEFVSTSLTQHERRQFTMVTDNWCPFTAGCHKFQAFLRRLLDEWGAFLDTRLYQEALTHFLGGNDRVIRMVEVKSANEIIGSQEMHLLTDDIAFSITAYTQRPESLMVHQQRFLNHTDLLAIQWVNLNHGRIELRTIRRS